MKIMIKSNFVIPGLEDEGSLELNVSKLTLREFLENLSKLSPDPLDYVAPGADRLDPDDWEVEINDVPYQDFEEGLGKSLNDGDTVTIRVLAQGGG
jgi:hypothetical protein